MKIIPMNDKVVVERLEPEATTKGGILLPEASREAPAEGRVLSIGQGIRDSQGKLHEFQVKEGDRVLYSHYTGTEFQLDGKSLLILRESDILAILK